MDYRAVLRRGYWTDVVVRGVNEPDNIPKPHPVINLHLKDKSIVIVIHQREIMYQSLHRHDPGVPEYSSPPVIDVVYNQVSLESVPGYLEIV